MKLKILAIKNFQEYTQAYQNHQQDSQLYPKPEAEYVITIANIKDENVLDYFIKPAELTQSGKKEIEISVDNGFELQALKTIHTDNIEKELDKIIEISNKKYREI